MSLKLLSDTLESLPYSLKEQVRSKFSATQDLFLRPVFADEVAANYVLGKSWVAEAIRSFGIEVFVKELPDKQELLVKTAQVRQRMVNQ
jgi:hypothetical protein